MLSVIFLSVDLVFIGIMQNFFIFDTYMVFSICRVQTIAIHFPNVFGMFQNSVQNQNL